MYKSFDNNVQMDHDCFIVPSEKDSMNLINPWNIKVPIVEETPHIHTPIKLHSH